MYRSFKVDMFQLYKEGSTISHVALPIGGKYMEVGAAGGLSAGGFFLQAWSKAMKQNTDNSKRTVFILGFCGS